MLRKLAANQRLSSIVLIRGFDQAARMDIRYGERPLLGQRVDRGSLPPQQHARKGRASSPVLLAPVLLAPVVLALVLAAVFAPRAVAANLISIKGVSIGADEHVAGFDLVTDGLDVLAVCHVLDDWTVTVSNGSPPDSHISGVAHNGASSLPATKLDRLRQLFLVEANSHVARSVGHPPSITGFLTLGLYGDGGRFRKLTLGSANIGWEGAANCR